MEYCEVSLSQIQSFQNKVTCCPTNYPSFPISLFCSLYPHLSAVLPKNAMTLCPLQSPHAIYLLIFSLMAQKLTRFHTAAILVQALIIWHLLNCHRSHQPHWFPSVSHFNSCCVLCWSTLPAVWLWKCHSSAQESLVLHSAYGNKPQIHEPLTGSF